MSGFAGAAIGLAFAGQLAALDLVLALHFLEPDAGTQEKVQVVAEAPPAARALATQKRMRNPWEAAGSRK